MATGRIHVTEPNGVKRSKPISTRGLSIGRGEENDLVVNYASASRRHAQIDCDGHNFYVTDLESGNGTFLGNASIPANTPTLWRAGVPLYIGDVLFELEAMKTTDSWSGTISGMSADDLRRAAKPDEGGSAWRWILISLALAAVLTVIMLAVYYLAFYR